MSRFKRPEFNFALFKDEPIPEARNRQFFDWWCDDADRASLVKELHAAPPLSAKLWRVPSRAPLQNDPAPPHDQPAPQGVRDIVLLTGPEDVHEALTDHASFSNIPYAGLGGASFLLAQDPGKDASGVDWHAEQRAFIHAALQYDAQGLQAAACLAVEQAALTALARPDFDLALFAEQAGLRYFGLLFGYATQDHGLLEDAARCTYQALQYLAIGQHFVTEPGTLPAAQQALGRLVTRTSSLIEAYERLRLAPRRYGEESHRDRPDGVLPWSELGLGTLSPGQSLLERAARMDSPLSGRDRAVVIATLLAGTLGNVQTAVCSLVQDRLAGDGVPPPVPVVPRRTRGREVILKSGASIPANTDCLLLLIPDPSLCPHANPPLADDAVWGDVPAGSSTKAAHACLGRDFARPLITALVDHTLGLRGLKSALDLLTGETLKAERLWGFACTRYLLQFERERVRVQRNLIVSMRVKSPISENAARLRRVIAAAVPRIDHLLAGFGHVHFAWFEFSDDDSHLVLRTIYDGAFESYIQHFALRAGDLFDALFEFIEDAPQRPVSEHPKDFVDTIRRYNRTPLAGYLFSAYPDVKAAQVRPRAEPRP